MNMTFARASFSSSDESSVDASTRPTTPEWSPYMLPQQPNRPLEAYLQPLNHVDSADQDSQAAPAALTENLDPSPSVRNVCVIGAGYVGGPTAAVLALHNPDIKVTVLDRDPVRIASWKSQHLPIHESGLENVVRVARDGGRRRSSSSSGLSLSNLDVASSGEVRKGNLYFSTDSATSIGTADVVFLAVNTPTKRSGRGAGAASDLSALESAARDVAIYARNGTIVVEKSTVPCGTAHTISAILASTRPDETLPILSNPEFLAEGSAIKNLLYPDRVLIGSAPSVVGRFAAKRLGALYAAWVPENKILYTNVWSSELAKLVANAMLAQRISSMNSISALCERTGADVREIARAVGTDERIGSRFLQSGLGFGGSCFRKDISSLVYISESLGLPEVAAYWRAVLSINMFQRERFSDKIVNCLNNTLSGKKIVLLGFAYKKNTGDTRESLAVDVIASLMEERPREIAIFDPCCPESGVFKELANIQHVEEVVRVYGDPYEACQDASTVAILTEWDFFKTDRTLPMLRAAAQQVNTVSMDISAAEKPLLEYAPPDLEPCVADCSSCTSTRTRSLYEATQRLDWARVAESLKYPRYILDGRGVLDERAMKSIGLEVDGLGWGANAC